MSDHVECYVAKRTPDGTFGPLRPLNSRWPQQVRETESDVTEHVSTSEIFPALAKAIAAAYRRDEERRRGPRMAAVKEGPNP